MPELFQEHHTLGKYKYSSPDLPFVLVFWELDVMGMEWKEEKGCKIIWWYRTIFLPLGAASVENCGESQSHISVYETLSV